VGAQLAHMMCVLAQNAQKKSVNRHPLVKMFHNCRCHPHPLSSKNTTEHSNYRWKAWWPIFTCALCVSAENTHTVWRIELLYAPTKDEAEHEEGEKVDGRVREW